MNHSYKIHKIGIDIKVHNDTAIINHRKLTIEDMYSHSCIKGIEKAQIG